MIPYGGGSFSESEDTDVECDTADGSASEECTDARQSLATILTEQEAEEEDANPEQPVPTNGIFRHRKYGTLHVGSEDRGGFLCKRKITDAYQELSCWPVGQYSLCKNCASMS